VARDLPDVGPPEGGKVFRVAWGVDPFAPPDWGWAQVHGTFGNRFDDPGAYHGIKESNRFRVCYCATQPEGAFGETIARFRKAPTVGKDLQLLLLEDHETPDPDLEGGKVPKEWRLQRSLGTTQLDETLLFADFANGETLTILGKELASLLARFRLREIDLSTITSQQRRLTQEAARYVYELDKLGLTGFAGIRYVSRLHEGWELWAIFHDLMVHTPEQPRVIRKEDPDLQKAAKVLGLRVN